MTAQGYAYWHGLPWSYETHYRCADCGTVDPKVRHVNQTPICPDCGQRMRGRKRG